MKNISTITMIAFFVTFLFVIISIIIIKSKKKKKYKNKIADLDYAKNKLIGIPILTELDKVKELVKTDNLKLKLNEWEETFKDIKNNQIDKLTDLITEADFDIERNQYQEALKKIANIEININLLDNKTKELLDEIKVITKSEERNRSIVTKLKVIFRECESKYDRRKKEYGPLSKNIESYINKIDKKFTKFETLMDKNDYVSVEKLVIEMEKEINILKEYLEKTPDLVLISTIMIPSKIEEVNTAYSRMQRDGYPLDYLNVEYNIKEITEKVDAILARLKKFDLENADIELKTMLEYFDTIFNNFDKERDAKDTFRENIKKLKNKLESINKVVYDIYLQLDDIKSTYDLSDTEVTKFDTVSKELERINEDYKVLFEHGKGKTFAYSKLVEELEGLGNRLTRLQDDLDYRLKSITSMKDDEYRAKEQLDMIQKLLVQSKSKIKEYKIPIIPSSYYIELEEASEAIREIIKELSKKPIVIKILNIRVDTARDLVFKIYNKTNDIAKNVILCEKLIVYGNRYRSVSEEIDKSLNKSVELFRLGKYKQSMDNSIKAIETIDPNVMTKFELEKQLQ